MKKVLFILLIVICIVQLVRTQECTVTETEAAGLAYQTLRLGLADRQSRSLAALAIGTTLESLPPPTADMAGSMQLWQFYKWGAGIDPGRFYEVERYWNEYYAAQQRAANIFANQQRRKTVWEEIKTDVGDRIGEGFDGAIVAAESLGEIIRTIVENPWKALIIFGVDYEDAEAAGLVSSFMWQMTKEFVKEKAQAVADIIFPNLQIVEPEGLPPLGIKSQEWNIQRTPLWGWGGSPAISMLMAQLRLGGASFGPVVEQSINEWYDAYYAAQERAMRNAVKLLP